MKTKIKQANWKSKLPFGKNQKYHNIVTTVFYQGKDVFIDTTSKFLFEIICKNFFYKYKDRKLTLELSSSFGAMFPKGYMLYVYNMIYKELTGKKIKNDILKVKDNEELYYRVMLDIHMDDYHRRVLKIIKILNINLKKESDRFSKILFNTKGKKDFYLTEKRTIK